MALSKGPFWAEGVPVYTCDLSAIHGTVLILFPGDAAAVTVPVEDDIQAVTQLHAVHDAFPSRRVISSMLWFVSMPVGRLDEERRSTIWLMMTFHSGIPSERQSHR